jgi:RimJ/RimL family protein N-acetyltransferase
MGGEDEETEGAKGALLTARLLLRRLRASDTPVMAKLSADQAVAENLCHAISLAGGTAFAVTLRGDGVIIGCAGHGKIEERPDSHEAGLWIGIPWWGRGYGTEAAQALVDHAFADDCTDALWCSNRVTNTRARRVIEKCGFQFRGTGMVRSPTLFGAFPVERFVLDRRNWASLKAWGAPDRERGRPQRETAA